MKFDCIITNPPYQAPQKNKGKRGGGTTLWNQFIEKVFPMINGDGYLCAIHPPGWRNYGGRYQKVQDIIKNKIKYLEIHDSKDGLKTFGCNTRYDWYIAPKKSVKNTDILTQDSVNINLDLSKMKFIPNGMYSEIGKLFGSGINLIESCLYHISNKNTRLSKNKTGEYIYPCVVHVSKRNNLPSCVYYSKINKEHFGVPKIIFSRQFCGVLIDSKGEYGVTHNATAIVDEIENLEKIQKALLSEKFLKIMKFCEVSCNGNTYCHRIFKLFRKDFWKDFI